MGNCKSLFGRSKGSDLESSNSWAERRPGPKNLQKHQQACKASDFVKAFSLRQAFHTAPGTKGPSELSCSSCGKFIAEASGQQQFYACVSCWKMGHALGICTTCFQNERYCFGEVSPESPERLKKLRTSNGSMAGSISVKSVVPPPLTEPEPPSSDSEEVEEIPMPGEVVMKKTRSRRRSSISRRPRRASDSSPISPEPDDLSDSPAASVAGDTKGKMISRLSSQTSMKSTQLSTQGSVSSLKSARRVSSQLELPPDAGSTSGSPSPNKSLRRLSTHELQNTSPVKSQSDPTLTRRMSVPAKQRTRRMSSQTSMKSTGVDAGSSGSPSPQGDAAAKRKATRRMSSQASMKSSGSRRMSLPAGGEGHEGRPSTGKGKRRNSTAVPLNVDRQAEEKEREEEEKRQAEERRKSNASQRSVANLQQRDQAPLPSGTWFATFVEGRKKHIRKEERHLIFTTDGIVAGAGNFNSSLEGRFKLPNVQWTETYAWGTIKVKLELLKVPLRLEGTFETSDRGTGSVTFLPADSGV